MRRVARIASFLSPVLVVLTLSKVHAAYVADPPYDYTGSARFAWSLLYMSVLVLAAYGSGLPELPRGTRSAAAAATAASAVGALFVSAVQLVVGDALLPRFVVFGSALALVPIHVAIAAVSQRGRDRDRGRDRVVFVGSDSEMAQLEVDLGLAVERPALLVGRFEVDALDQGHAVQDKTLVVLAAEAEATVLVMDRSALGHDTIVEQASLLHEAGVRVRSLTEFYEEWLGKLPISELERASLFFDISELHRVRYGRVKRLVDLVGASLGLVPLVLAVPLVVLGDLLANRGPLLFRQTRVGRGGVPFEILKFRTMVPVADDDANTSWTTERDPRITRFGRLLRVSHLDELPQMLNILRGDLSLVGPRPEQPRYVAELSAKLPFYGMRHLVRPGLTGWAQVKYGYAGDERDALEKLQYEFFYLRKQSLRFDAQTIGRTVRSVLGGPGSGR